MKHPVLSLPAKFGITLLVCSLLSACGGGGETTNTNSETSTAPSNPVQQPQINQSFAIQAVASQKDIAVGDKIELTAQGFYTEGEITKFEWQQEAGASVELLSNTQTGQAWFKAPKDAANTALKFVLVAISNDGKSHKDNITINVGDTTNNTSCMYVTSKSGNKNNVFFPVELNEAATDAAVIDLFSGETLTINYRDCSVVPITHVNSEIVSQNIPLSQVHHNTYAPATQYPGFEIHPVSNSTGRVTVSATVHFANGQNSVFTHVINVI